MPQDCFVKRREFSRIIVHINVLLLGEIALGYSGISDVFINGFLRSDKSRYANFRLEILFDISLAVHVTAVVVDKLEVVELSRGRYVVSRRRALRRK